MKLIYFNNIKTMGVLMVKCNYLSISLALLTFGLWSACLAGPEEVLYGPERLIAEIRSKSLTDMRIGVSPDHEKMWIEIFLDNGHRYYRFFKEGETMEGRGMVQCKGSPMAFCQILNNEGAEAENYLKHLARYLLSSDSCMKPNEEIESVLHSFLDNKS